MNAAHSEKSPTERRVLKACLPLPGEVGEKVASDLFPVLECPRDFYSVETRFQTESEVIAACKDHGPQPFLLRSGQLIAFAPFMANSVLAPALKTGAVPVRKRVVEWLAEPERAQLVIDLLDRMLRYHAWKRGLRFDEMHKLYYFTRSKPKSIFWEIGGCKFQQEVTAPLMKWSQTEIGIEAEAQFGWRHRAVRAGFVQNQDALFVCLEPTWFITELDGRTPATARQAVPVDPDFESSGSSSERLRSLQFWSTVLTKGHRELRIDAGRNPIRVRLIPPMNSNESAIADQRTNPERLAIPDLGEAQEIPELAAIEA